ncbi:hypothetical protein F0562_011565 [Nyssa sinensis]|uniref:AAA+ ATPase domain-containing protein n=1 Tax=Nyssa sinensis TaxID=561372 RepID=A0A5J4ZU26_9ASTE|nr:hypothetical protein F0562_011565 [Nyssa sinensis]
MEQKHILMSALSVGIGVGVGFGLASGQTVSKWTGDSKVTFEEFPYYLSEQTRVLLTNAAFVHLKKADFSKHTRNLSPASRTILLSGPAELYQQILAKALAHYFEAKLLLLDATDFSLKIQTKYGATNKESSFKRSISETTLGRMSGLLGQFSMLQPREESKGTLRRQSSGVDIGSRGAEGFSNPPKLRRNASASANMDNLTSQCTPANPAPLKRTSSWSFDEKLFIQTLYKVLVSVSKTNPIVLYLRDVEKLLFRSQRMYILFQKMLKKLSGSVLILGSRILDPGNDYREVDERLTSLFPYNIEIKPPKDETHLVSWKSQLEEDMKMIQFQDNRNHIIEVLSANDLDCDDLETGKLVISSASLSHGLSIFQEGKSGGRDTLKLEAQAEPSKDAQLEAAPGVKPEIKTESTIPENKSEAEASAPAVKDGDNSVPASKALEVPDNEFEKRIRPEVIPASEIGVTFADIGALDEIKESLQELVMLPLRRPDLFKGDEKNVRALFTLAAKVSPTIIFVDEVDSMLGQRSRAGEHEAMRKIKNEFMTHWDGLLTKLGERILVLAATNRPFDLDEAIIRRFERRIMVGLPSVENREMILKTLLAKEKVDEELEFKELATMTEGYSGSDLKNFCTTAAYRPVRELIQQERLKDLERKRRAEEGQNSEDTSATAGEEERVITIRPLNMEDFRVAKNQVAASFAAEGSIMSELKQWNELYGEGGSRKKEQLSYFL